MNKEILELNIPEENKILLSKIEKRIPFLSAKAEDYFRNLFVVKTEKIEGAYSVNEDLISILTEKNDLTKNLRRESFEIRENHQTDFTREITLTVTKEIDEYSLIKSTIDQKDKLITADEKLFALTKRKNFIKNSSTKRKAEMERAINDLEVRISNEELLNIAPMKEDIDLIKKYIDPREINKTRYLFLFVLIPLIIFLLTVGGVIIWSI